MNKIILKDKTQDALIFIIINFDVNIANLKKKRVNTRRDV